MAGAGRGGWAAAALLLAAGGCDTPPELSGAASGWNVLLLSVDTLRADHLGSYGYRVRETSPAIDDLLARGVVFERAVAPRAATWPALGSVLTGLYPSAHGVLRNGYRFVDEVELLPEALQGAGYWTAAFLRNMCDANHHGWDYIRCVRGDANVAKHVRGVLRHVPADRPFFFWIHYIGAHGPYYNGGDLARELDPGYAGPLAPTREALDGARSSPEGLHARDLVHLNALYDAAILRTDERIGRLLADLAAWPRFQRTVIVFLSDHGEELYEHHRYLYHACSVYQTALHVPLALVAPGPLPAGLRIPGPVELLDVAPTLLDLLGLPPLPESQGRSLLPALADPDLPGRPAFSEYGDTQIRTVLRGRWKLVDNPAGESPACAAAGPGGGPYPIAPLELYDLDGDPGEQRNLAAREPGVVAELREHLRRRFDGALDRRRRQEIPEQLQQRLRALGYLTDDGA